MASRSVYRCRDTSYSKIGEIAEVNFEAFREGLARLNEGDERILVEVHEHRIQHVVG